MYAALAAGGASRNRRPNVLRRYPILGSDRTRSGILVAPSRPPAKVNPLRQGTPASAPRLRFCQEEADSVTTANSQSPTSTLMEPPTL